MTRLTPRMRWQKALRSEAFPANLRVVKGTLLSLIDEMSTVGELHQWRIEIAQATGLPARTLDRHLQRAVDAGWLVRKVPGGNGRKALYLAQIPWELCATSGAQNGKLCAVCSCATPGSCAPPGGELNKDSASESERGAVDSHRGRRRTVVGQRVSPHEHSGKGSSYRDEWLPAPSRRPSSDSTGQVA